MITSSTSLYTDTAKAAKMNREMSALPEDLQGNRGINISIKADMYIFVLPGKGRIP